MRPRLTGEATAELKEIAQWYEDQRAGLGEQFVSAVIEALSEIERHPQRFPRSALRTLREVRACRLHKFPHSLIYQIQDVSCNVVAIAHPSRRPAYWRSRIV
jgi:toxin ParE1/3/4